MKYTHTDVFKPLFLLIVMIFNLQLLKTQHLRAEYYFKPINKTVRGCMPLPPSVGSLMKYIPTGKKELLQFSERTKKVQFNVSGIFVITDFFDGENILALGFTFISNLLEPYRTSGGSATISC
ncbi:hypothetical protein ILYODFUR_027134 [Ilyodon furcidens]|uniref:Uncharacterized protein n=1 Tax=Ilyodon furcidens TaxID=33524 RepID=A0ABV0UA10_9TELE